MSVGSAVKGSSLEELFNRHSVLVVEERHRYLGLGSTGGQAGCQQRRRRGPLLVSTGRGGSLNGGGKEEEPPPTPTTPKIPKGWPQGETPGFTSSVRDWA